MNRRSVLSALTAAGVTGLAGCAFDSNSGGDTSPTPVINREVSLKNSSEDSIPQFQGNPANTGYLDFDGPSGSVSTYWRRTPHRYEHSQPVVFDDRVYVSFAGLLVSLDITTGEPEWTTNVGHDGASTPAVHDGTVYTTVWNGGEDVARGLAAVDTAGGDIQWRASTDADITTAPTVTDEGVFVGGGFETASVAAFDHDGTERWVNDLSEYASTPAVVDGTVYYGAGDSRVVAYDAGSGDPQWVAETDGETTASPTVVGELVLVGTGAGTLYAFDIGDGAEAWSVDLAGPVRQSAAVADGQIVVPTEENLAAFDREGDRLWTVESIAGGTTPVVADDTVYVGDSQTLRAISLADGQERWSFETRERSYTDVFLGGIRAPPTVTNDVVIVATQAGDVYTLGS